ncbi:MAG: hypothetical protein ACOYBC_02105 [Bilifractor sp.]
MPGEMNALRRKQCVFTDAGRKLLPFPYKQVRFRAAMRFMRIPSSLNLSPDQEKVKKYLWLFSPINETKIFRPGEFFSSGISDDVPQKKSGGIAAGGQAFSFIEYFLPKYTIKCIKNVCKVHTPEKV